MTGPWEQSLINFAESEEWELTSEEQLITKLARLRFVMDKVAGEPGLTGESGMTATETFSEASGRITDIIIYLEEQLSHHVASANAERSRAQGALAQLSGGSLTPEQEAMVRGAAVGATIVFGPLSILAGEGAVGALNAHLGAQREADARDTVELISTNLNATPVPTPPRFPKPGETPGPEDNLFDSEPGFEGGSGGGTNRPGFQDYPNFDVRPTGPSDSGVLITPNPTDSTPTGPLPPGPRGPIVDIGHFPPGPETVTPTPDGPIDGGYSTLPGTVNGPSSGIGGGSAIGGGSSAGGGLGVGLAAGAGGAAALARAGKLGAGGIGGSKLAGGAGGKLGGGTVGAGRGAGLSGGLLGKSAGPAGGAGTAAAGTRGGMMGGGGGSGAPAAGGGGRGGGKAGGLGGAGGAGGRSRDDKKNQGRGLGGPIAPHLDDDEDFGPRSENAGAGGRE
ncbi:hypothetical protein [Microbacterium sp. P05]|uniref:hypothetical protein n=1 Tax=Microbacterium sp. P05 TaxID=3366948 RepID=UPI00374774CA